MFSQSKLLTSNIPRTDLRIAPDLAFAHTNAKFKDSQELLLARKPKQSALICGSGSVLLGERDISITDCLTAVFQV